MKCAAKAITHSIAGHECWMFQLLITSNGACSFRFSFLDGDERVSPVGQFC